VRSGSPRAGRSRASSGQEGPSSSRTAPTPTSASSARSARTIGAYGRAPLPTGTQPPTSTHIPSAAQRAVSSAIRRVLPTRRRPHQDDDRLGICGPPPGHLEGLQLLDPADEGRARHAATHLAGIIPRDRPQGNGGRKEAATKDGAPASANV
jgi:hypothetical protein